jgi:replicative DNA helicase
VLLDNETMWIYDSDKINHKDFYQKEHSFIYEAIQQLWGARKTIDVVTLSDQLDKNGNLDAI